MGRPVPCRDRTWAPLFQSPSCHPHKFTLSCALPLLSPFGLPSPIWHLAVVPSASRTATECVATFAGRHKGCPCRPLMPAVPGIPACVHSTLKASAPCLTPPFPSVLWSLSPPCRSHWRTCSLSDHVWASFAQSFSRRPHKLSRA